MRVKPVQDKSQLRAVNRFFGDPMSAAAHAALMQSVFDDAPHANLADWTPFALFDHASRCVAAVEVRPLPLDLGGIVANVGAVRRVAVDPAWRGRGLMHEVMVDAMAWCDAEGLFPVFLFTETPALYGSLGFAPVAQHAFVGPPPLVAPAATGAPARRLDLRRPDDMALLQRRLAARTPVSSRGGLAGAPDLVLARLLAAPDLVCLDLSDLETIVVLDEDTSDLTIVDVIASRIPSLAAILGALGVDSELVSVSFAPDRLDWTGEPEREDTGLMARGALPAALRDPFMLPATAEF